jgi:hypothetical protein
LGGSDEKLTAFLKLQGRFTRNVCATEKLTGFIERASPHGGFLFPAQ